MPVRGVLIAIAHERVLSFPSRWLQPKPKLCWLVLAVIECPKIQQHTQALPNPCSTMCLFSPLLKQRTQVCETTKGLVSELRWGAISPLRLDVLETLENVFGLCARDGCAAWVYACVHTQWQLARTLQSWRHCDDLSQHSTPWCHWLKYHMEWHMAPGAELTCLPPCLPTCQRKGRWPIPFPAD